MRPSRNRLSTSNQRRVEISERKTWRKNGWPGSVLLSSPFFFLSLPFPLSLTRSTTLKGTRPLVLHPHLSSLLFLFVRSQSDYPLLIFQHRCTRLISASFRFDGPAVTLTEPFAPPFPTLLSADLSARLINQLDFWRDSIDLLRVRGRKISGRAFFLPFNPLVLFAIVHVDVLRVLWTRGTGCQREVWVSERCWMAVMRDRG